MVTYTRSGRGARKIRMQRGRAGKPRGIRGKIRFKKGYDRTGGYYGRYKSGLELKFRDFNTDMPTMASAGTIRESFCTIAQGTGESNRIGRKCVIKSINWRFKIELPITTGTSAQPSDVVRIILYLDKQTNGAAATVTDILENALYQSFNNLANKSRFRTLMDRTYDMNYTAAAGDGAANDWAATKVSDTFFKKCNIPLEFDGTTGLITELRSNNIGILAISDNSICILEGQFRIRFSDS